MRKTLLRGKAIIWSSDSHAIGHFSKVPATGVLGHPHSAQARFGNGTSRMVERR